MAARTPKKMVALKVLETSGVDHPAHLEEGWIVMKNSEEPMADETVVDMNDATIDRIVELEAELAKARETIASLSKTDATVDPEEGDDDAAEEGDMLKSLPEPVRAMLAKAQDDANAAREELRKEREMQADRAYVAKAAGWSNLTIDAATLGVALRKAADFDADMATAIEQALDAANAQQEAAAIFSELGKSTTATGGNTYSKVTSLAKAAVERGEFQTVEQAVSGLIAKNPDLYDEYLSENR